MKIAGFMPLTLLDYPGVTAATVFIGGCNFRCPFCHNSSLVTNCGEGIGEEELFAFLEKRKKLLDGVCISGGEPLMYPETEKLIDRIKSMGFLVKLDTNGSFPHFLEKLISSKKIDYVAMDIKNCPEKYSLTAGVETDISKITKSIRLLMEGNVEYEFRTTVFKPYHQENDIEKIGMWIQGAEKYFLQGFILSDKVSDRSLAPFTADEMELFRLKILKYVKAAKLRGIN